MSSLTKTIFLLLLIFFLAACNRQSVTAPLVTVSPSITTTAAPTLTPTAASTSTSQSPAPKHLFSLGNGEIPKRVEYSPDGNFIFVLENGTDRKLKLRWLDAQTKKELTSFSAHQISTNGVFAYSQDESLIAIQISDLEIYRMDNQQKVFSVKPFADPFGQIMDVKFSLDNHYLVYRSYDSDNYGLNTLQVWDIEKQKLAYFIPATDLKDWEYNYGPDRSVNIPANAINPTGSLSNTVIDPSGKFFAVGDSKGNIFIWNLATGKLLQQLTGHSNGVTSLSLSPDGRLLASGSSDGTVRLWNMPNGSLARVATGFLGEVTSVAFTPDGKQLDVKLDNYPPNVVDLKTGKLTAQEEKFIPASNPYLADLLQKGYISSYNRAIISPDGKTLVLTDPSSFIVRWDIPTKTVKDNWLVPQGGQVQNITYDAKGQILALVQNGRESFSVWNTQTNQQIFPATGWQKIKNQEDYSQNVFLAPGGSFAAVSMDHHIEIWNLLQGQLITDLGLTTPKSYVDKIIFSQDGSQLYAFVSDNGNKDSILVFDVKSGQQLKTISLSNHYERQAIYWPFFAGIFKDENNQTKIELWNLENNPVQKMQSFNVDDDPHICFTPDGSLLSLGKYFLKTDTAQLVYTGENIEFNCSALSPDGKQMVRSGESKVDFWDIQALMQLAHSNSITPVILPTSQATQTPSPIPAHQPTLALTPVATPVLPAGAIVPENASQLKGNTRFGQGNIEQVLWTANSTSILTVGSQGMYEYDAKTLARSNLQKPGTWLKGTTLTIDGRRLVICQNGEKVQVQDLTNDKLLVEVTGQNPSISPDGKILAYIDNDIHTDRIHILDIETGQPLLDLLSMEQVDRAIFSPDSQLVAAVQYRDYERQYNRSIDETVRVWDVHTGKILNALGGPNAQITSVAFSKDGKYMVGVAGGSAWVWPLALGAKPTSITLDAGHEYSGYLLFDIQVTGTALSSDNRILAVGTSQREILLYDWRSGHILRKLAAQNNPVTLLSFSPNLQRLLSVDQNGLVLLWDAQTGKQLASQGEHTDKLDGMRFGDDDNLLAWSNHTFLVIHPQDATTLHSISIVDGKIFAASPDALHLATYLPYHISLRNAQTGMLEQTLKDEPDELADWGRSNTRKDFTAATFSSDSKLLVVGGTLGLWLYDLAGNLIGRFYGGTPNPPQLIFNPTHQQVASCGSYVCVANVVGNNQAYIYLSECALNIAFNPAGDLWAGLEIPCLETGPSHQILIRQVATGDDFKILPIPQASLTSLAFNADGRLLAVGQADGKILLIETESLKVLATLAGHNGSVDHLAFSNTGKWLASGAADGSISFWNIP